jgi:RNA polymerase sigma-70 factor (ECF subfamily)
MSDESERREMGCIAGREFPLEWVRLSRAGDRSAMESLYTFFKSPFFGLAYRYTGNSATAEDLLQDIFVKIFTHMDNLDSDDAFTGWAYRIAVNTCLSYLRRRKTVSGKVVSLDAIGSGLADPKVDSPERDLSGPIQEALAGLSGKLKSVFLLHDFQGFKHHEIAGILGCSVGTSKSQLFKARIKIRAYLRKKQLI